MTSAGTQPTKRSKSSPATEKPCIKRAHALLPRRRAFLTVLAVGLATLLVTACGDAPEAELSVETQLEALAGEDLTPAEIARQVEIAGTLCGMSDEVLAAIWDQLGEEQLAFQDFVFGSHCPERSVTYGLATGRTLTPEARVAVAERDTDDTSGASSTVVLPETSSSTSTPDSTTTTSALDQPGPSISIDTDG